MRPFHVPRSGPYFVTDSWKYLLQLGRNRHCFPSNGLIRTWYTQMIATNTLTTAQLIILMSQRIHKRNAWILTYVLRKTFRNRGISPFNYSPERLTFSLSRFIKPRRSCSVSFAAFCPVAGFPVARTTTTTSRSGENCVFTFRNASRNLRFH